MFEFSYLQLLFSVLEFSNSFKSENFEMLHFLNTLIKDSQLICKDKMKQF